MANVSRLEHLFLAWLSRPASDRPLYRAIRRQGFCSLVEIGVGTGRRALRLIRAAQGRGSPSMVCYTGIDLFELRPVDQGTPLTLKDAYRQLKATGARIRLIPGDPFAALARHANNLTGSDLVVISAEQQGEALERAWFYVPRMLQVGSHVYVEAKNGQTGVTELRLLSAADIQRLASDHARRAAA